MSSHFRRWHTGPQLCAATMSHEDWMAMDLGQYILGHATKYYGEVLKHINPTVDNYGLDDSMYAEIPSLFIEIGVPTLSKARAANSHYEGGQRDKLLRGTLRSIVLKRVKASFYRSHTPAHRLPGSTDYIRSHTVLSNERLGLYATSFDDPSDFPNDARCSTRPIACLADNDDSIESIVDGEESGRESVYERNAYLLELIRSEFTTSEYQTLHAILVDGLQVPDLARHLNCEDNTIYSRLNRARAKLTRLAATRAAAA